MLEKWIAFVKTHETLLLGGGLLFVVLSLGNRWLDHAAQKADVKAVVAQQVVTQDVAQNQGLAAQLAAQKGQYDRLAQTTKSKITALQAAVSSRDAEITARQAADQILPSTDLATRWQNILQLSPGAIIPGPGDAMTVTGPAAKATVGELEVAPVLAQDLKDLETENGSQKGQLEDLQKVNDLYGRQVMGLQTQLTDADKACKAETSALKAEARKGKLKWLVRGILVGAGLAAYLLR